MLIKGEYVDVACPVCEQLEFENIDFLKSESAKQKLCLCKTCGHIIYNPQPTNVSLINFYKNDYRGKVELNNIITSNRKLQYHKAFLTKKILDKKGRACDVGCATGYLPAWLESLGWDAVGTEHTKGFVSFAKNHYGIDIKDHITDFEGEFDLISYYHVLEHIQHPHLELMKTRKKLNDDGYLYLAVPVFDILAEASGTLTKNFDNLVPLPHLNYFSQIALTSMLNKVGFEIVQTNKHYYGLTILAKKADPKTDIKARNYKEVFNILQDMSIAIKLLKQKDWEGAVERFPKFPEAWLTFAAQSKKFKDSMDILNRALKVMPTVSSISENIGHTFFRNNDFAKAIDTYKYAFLLKPGNEMICRQVGVANLELQEYDKALKWFKKGMEINPAMMAEWYKWLGLVYAKM